MNSDQQQPCVGNPMPCRFRKQGSRLIILIIVAVGVGYAIYQWQRCQQRTTHQSAAVYAETIAHFSQQRSAQAADQLQTFAQQNNQNIYSVLALMQSAKYAIDQQDYTKAEQQLTQALKQSKESNIQALLRLRLAKVQWQLKQPEAALVTLQGIAEINNAAAGWVSKAHMARGDILLSQKDIQKARAAYQQAMSAEGSHSLRSLLQMKLDDINGEHS